MRVAGAAARAIGLALFWLLVVGAIVFLLGFVAVAVISSLNGERMPLIIVGIVGLLTLAAWALVNA